MIVLLLLGASLSLGLSYDEVNYGETYRIRIQRRTHTIKHIKPYSSSVTILWNRDDPPATGDSRTKLEGSYFLINSVTQRDSGIYTLRDKDQNHMSTKTLEVISLSRFETLKSGDLLTFGFDLKKEFCNIYFYPNDEYEIPIALQGSMTYEDEHDCSGFDINMGQYYCSITIEHVNAGCNGRFEIRDQHDNKASVLTLEVESSVVLDTPTYISIGGTAFLVVAFCCCCVKCCKRCHGKKGSSKKNRSESPDADSPDADSPDSDADSATNFPTYNREPVGPRRDQISQPSEPLYPAPPSYSPCRPLVTASAAQVDAPTPPVPSEDPGPRFELSIGSAPLSSESPFSYVYTSDKLNFR
ncbi:uncharacterized protein LOC117817987 isoform X2 [Notolabrus celidotus]|uniref:uncharacterized protein LOC117817987 isoform X2 n=1 Tax=Notolabrus celidotus TaxID=1203425 RepID=UPI00149066F7|nr:uncharacterized protein LOC117817987 isoform X2 [Notolabrus celidotus]